MQWEPLQAMVAALTDQGVPTSVAVVGNTAPSAVPPKKRGRPPLGTTPAASRSDAATPLASGNGASDDLMLPPGVNTGAVSAAADVADAVAPDEDDDPFGGGLPTAGRTGKEALEQALSGLRSLFNANHRAVVKEIQAAFGVAQFSDIEPKDGHRLLAMVELAAQHAGMRV